MQVTAEEGVKPYGSWLRLTRENQKKNPQREGAGRGRGGTWSMIAPDLADASLKWMDCTIGEAWRREEIDREEGDGGSPRNSTPKTRILGDGVELPKKKRQKISRESGFCRTATQLVNHAADDRDQHLTDNHVTPKEMKDGGFPADIGENLQRQLVAITGSTCDKAKEQKGGVEGSSKGKEKLEKEKECGPRTCGPGSESGGLKKKWKNRARMGQKFLSVKDCPFANKEDNSTDSKEANNKCEMDPNLVTGSAELPRHSP